MLAARQAPRPLVERAPLGQGVAFDHGVDRVAGAARRPHHGGSGRLIGQPGQVRHHGGGARAGPDHERALAGVSLAPEAQHVVEVIGHLRGQVELAARRDSAVARPARLPVDPRGVDRRERVEEVLAPAGFAHQQAERVLAALGLADRIALQGTATAHVHDLRMGVDAILELRQASDRLRAALCVFQPGGKLVRVGRAPARSAQVLERARAEVHAPRREHAHVAPRHGVGAHLAALEHVRVEARVERRERGLEPDRAGSDDGDTVASGKWH